jgi:hypothetical protein
MKLVKTLALGALALASVASSFAADLGVVHVTGSSAYRAGALNGIKALFKTTGTTPLQYGWTGTGAFTSSTFAIFDGELNDGSGNTIRIATNFTGSAAGVQAIVEVPALSIPYLATARGSLSAGGTSGLSTPAGTATSDIAFSDVSISLTPFQRATDKAVTSPPSAAAGVAVIPFFWVANGGANSNITFMTNQLAKAVGAGGIPISFWSNNSADTGLVRVVGRNADSGTRLDAYEESGYGAATPATQYQPTPVTTNTTTAITGLQLYPAETVLGISFAAGKSGYPSGGNLVTQLTRPSSGVNFVSYLGRSDAVAALAAGARLLSYNGITPTITGVAANYTSAWDTAYVNGSYSFWSVQQMYYTDNHVADTVANIAEALAAQIVATPSSVAGINLADMKVVRGGEGQVITN